MVEPVSSDLLAPPTEAGSIPSPRWQAAVGAAVVLVAAGMALGILGVLLPTALAPLLGTLALFAAAGVLLPTLFASFYVAYRDIFGISEVV